MAGAADEYIFEARLVDRDAFDLAGKGFDHIGDEAMSILDLEAHLMIEHRRVQAKALFNALRQRLGVVGLQQNHVAADFALQFRRRAQRDDVAFGVDRQAIAALGLFHQVSGDQHGHAFFVAQNLQVLPQVAARAGIETGRRLIQQQHRRMMQQTLRQFQPPLHAAGKCLGFFFRAIGEPDAREHLGDALLQRGAAQPVNMADDGQVFFRGQLHVDALRLKDHADIAAHLRRIAGDIVSHDHGAAAGGNHQRRENAERRGLAAAVRAEQVRRSLPDEHRTRRRPSAVRSPY